MERSARDEDLLKRIRATHALNDARRTISLARVRCQPFDQLLERLRNVLSDEQPSEVIYAVIEAERNDIQNQALAVTLRHLAIEADRTTSRDKEWLDRQIGRLIRTLPPGLSQPLAREFLSHHRKGRRNVGFRCLLLDNIDDEFAQFLLQCLKYTGDIRFFKALLAQLLRLDCSNPRLLTDYFDDDEDYWRMRIVEAQLRADFSVGVTFAATHPFHFIWASGRIGDSRLIPLITDCLRSANDKVALVGIVAWAYGKLKAYEELEAMEPLLEDLAVENKFGWSQNDG